MHKLSELVERKFLNSIDMSEYEIWTDTGWEECETIHLTIEYEKWNIKMQNNLELSCADTHILFDENMNEIFAKDCIPFTTKIMTENGPSLAILIENTQVFENMFDITVKSRNHRFYTNGILSHNTTTVCAYFIWKLMFTPEFSIAILANKGDTAIKIVDRLKIMYEYLPEWLQVGLEEYNKKSIKFDNGSSVYAAPTSPSAIRGDSLNIVYLDEFAIVANHVAEEFFTSAYPTITSGTTTKIIITSTPKGMNLFYKIWTESEQKRNDYVRVDVHWSNVPGRTREWADEVIRNTSQKQFNQEFECFFLGSSNTLIDEMKLQQLVFTNPVLSNDIGLKIYEEAKEKELYVIVADTSRGVGLDYHAFIVVAVSQIPYRVVATFRNNSLSPLIYPNIIFDLAKKYNEAMVLVEINDNGQQIADILSEELEYEGVLGTTSNGRTGQVLTPGFGRSNKPGIKTSKQVKRVGCSTIKTLIESDKFLFQDYDMVQEFSRFALKGVSYEAEDGNDDLVMCTVLFGWMSTQHLFKDMTSVDTRKNIFDQNTKMIEDEMTPIGIRFDGEETTGIVDVSYNEFNEFMKDEEYGREEKTYYSKEFMGLF